MSNLNNNSIYWISEFIKYDKYCREKQVENERLVVRFKESKAKWLYFSLFFTFVSFVCFFCVDDIYCDDHILTVGLLFLSVWICLSCIAAWESVESFCLYAPWSICKQFHLEAFNYNFIRFPGIVKHFKHTPTHAVFHQQQLYALDWREVILIQISFDHNCFRYLLVKLHLFRKWDEKAFRYSFSREANIVTLDLDVINSVLNGM